MLDHAESILETHVQGFGYNLGYLLEIVEQPPEGVERVAGFVEDRGLLWAEYADARLPCLSTLRPVAERLDEASGTGDGAWAALADRIASRRSEEFARGRTVWSTGLSVQGFDAATYRRLLDVSGSFLQVIQASGADRVRGARRAGCGGRAPRGGRARWHHALARGLRRGPDGPDPRRRAGGVARASAGVTAP